jgi:hypothetical protein
MSQSGLLMVLPYASNFISVELFSIGFSHAQVCNNIHM